MGCDIHIYTEVKRTVSDKLSWFNCDHWQLNHCHDPSKPEEGAEYDKVTLWDGRDYRLFSVLANVRNYSENLFICNPKGLPDNVTDVVKKSYEGWGCDAHSASYFSLAELKEFRSQHPTTKYSGLMTPEDAEKVDMGGMPSSWCQGSSDHSYVSKEWERPGSPLDDLIEKLDKRMREEFWVYDEDDHPDFDHNIRVIFWFDN